MVDSVREGRLGTDDARSRCVRKRKKLRDEDNNAWLARIGESERGCLAASPLMWERLCRAGSAAGLAASPKLTGSTFFFSLSSLQLFPRLLQLLNFLP